MRPDRQDNFRAFMRVLLARGDWATLRSRPTRKALAALVGVCERSITTYTALAIELGYLTITEPGTTARIRAGRCYPAPDPYAGEGNHAQVVQIHIPACLAEEILEPYDAQEATVQPRVSAGQTETCAPSPGTCSTGGEMHSSHRQVTTPAPPTRARGTSRHGRPRTAKAEKKNSSPRPHHRPAGRGLWRARLAEVSAVWRLLPAELVELLAAHEAPRIADAIAVELEHRTVAELAERIRRHWNYWRFKLVAGLVRSPAAIAFRLVRRDFPCPDLRCEDRHQLDLDAPCKACTQVGEAIIADRRAALTAARLARYLPPQPWLDEPPAKPTPELPRWTHEDTQRHAEAIQAAQQGFRHRAAMRAALRADLATKQTPAPSQTPHEPLVTRWATEPAPEPTPPPPGPEEADSRHRHAMALARARREKIIGEEAGA